MNNIMKAPALIVTMVTYSIHSFNTTRTRHQLRFCLVEQFLELKHYHKEILTNEKKSLKQTSYLC